MPSAVDLTKCEQYMFSVPEPDLTANQMMARAVALRPFLREQQSENEERGYYSDLLHEQFTKAGFYRILQPRMFGGYEFDYVTFFKTMLAISRGHPSVGACLMLAAAHAPLVAARWSEQAQIELFGPCGHFAAARPALPSGTCVPVEDGFIVDGIWTCCTGIPHSTHFLGTTMLHAKDKPVTRVSFILPSGGYTIVDDWGGDKILGMRASGSNSVKVHQQFVPERFVTAFNEIAEDVSKGTIGTRIHGNSIYLGNELVPTHAAAVTSTVGAAQAALDEFRAIVMSQRTKRPAGTYRGKHYDIETAYGEALVLTDSAEALLLQALQLHMGYCDRWELEGVQFSVEENLRLCGMLENAGRFARDATELLFHTMGTMAVRRGSRMLRYFSDVQMHGSRLFSHQRGYPSIIGRANLGITCDAIHNVYLDRE